MSGKWKIQADDWPNCWHSDQGIRAGERILSGEATPQDAIDWMKLTSNGNEVRDKAIAILEKAITPAPAEVERLVEDLIGWAEIAGVDKYNGVEYMNNSIQSMLKAKSRLLAALPQPVPVEELEQDLEQYITLGSTGCRTIAEDVEFNRLHSKFLAALTNTTPYLSQDVKGVYKYEIDSPDELDVGLHGFSDEVTVIVDSGEPGGDPTGEDSFEEYMRQALIEWYDGAKVVVKKAGE